MLLNLLNTLQTMYMMNYKIFTQTYLFLRQKTFQKGYSFITHLLLHSSNMHASDYLRFM